MTSRQHALAALIDGESQPSGAIITDRGVVTASVTGEIRINGRPIGSWSTPVEKLARDYFAIVGLGGAT